MWSKQADSRNSANMTSLKSKITNRKRKNSKPSSNNSNQQQSSNNVSSNTNETTSTITNKKSSKKNKNNKKLNKKDTANKVPKEEINADEEKVNSNANALIINSVDNVDHIEKNCSDFIEPLLLNGMHGELPILNWERNNINTTTIHKRYSDSFVLDNDNNSHIQKLSRAQSGLNVSETQCYRQLIENKVDDNKYERKTRRFSDIFKPSNLKGDNNIKMQPKMVKKNSNNCDSSNNTELNDVTLRKKNVNAKENDAVTSASSNKEKKSGKADKTTVKDNAKTKKNKSDKPTDNKSSSSTTTKSDTNTTSYLKRVKSKIYKHKSENSVSVQPSMPNISEDVSSKKSKTKKSEEHFKPQEIRKSLTHLDFRLLRQSSNLERARSKSYMPSVKSSSNAGISELVEQTATILNVQPPASTSNKPFLAKSKSSSSINLNLLRTRRNKFFELLDKKNLKNLKMVEDEFEFIAFGDVPNYPLSEFGSLKNLNNNHVSKWIQEEGKN